MNILFLGPYNKNLVSFLKSSGDSVTLTENLISGNSECIRNKRFLISYKYRHILKEDVLEKFEDRAINLHISLLPWNRGADPNLWSILEDSPKGVTIHKLDINVDCGEIIAQERVDCEFSDTLKTSYQRLSNVIEKLFVNIWPKIRLGKIDSIPQLQGGTYHRLKDRAKYKYLLNKGWDTPIAGLIGKAKK